MRTLFGNFTGSPVTQNIQQEDGNFRMNNTSRSRRPRSGRRRDFAQERMAEREREARIRESEERRILQISDQIKKTNDLKGILNEDISIFRNIPRERWVEVDIESVKLLMSRGNISIEFDAEIEGDAERFVEKLQLEPAKRRELISQLYGRLQQFALNISSFMNQITQIHANRAEREQLAIEREFQRVHQEMEERMRERERDREARESNGKCIENKTDEELEEMAERASVRDITRMSVSKENIRALSSTRASLESAATRLRGEARFEMMRERITNDEIQSSVISYNRNKLDAHMRLLAFAEEMADIGAEIHVPGLSQKTAGHFFNNNPFTGFRGQHLQNLNAGIARTTSSINMQVGDLYRDSQDMQEEQLRIYREKSGEPEGYREEDDSTYDYPSIDLKL